MPRTPSMAGIKGRYRETQELGGRSPPAKQHLSVLKLVNGQIKRVDEPALTALNMRLRDELLHPDCAKGMLRWNKIISLAGYDFKLTLPKRRVPIARSAVQGHPRYKTRTAY